MPQALISLASLLPWGALSFAHFLRRTGTEKVGSRDCGLAQTYLSGTTTKTAALGFVVFEAWAFLPLASADFCSMQF